MNLDLDEAGLTASVRFHTWPGGTHVSLRPGQQRKRERTLGEYLLQQPPPTPVACTSSSTFTTLLALLMVAVYHPTRPPDLVPIRGHGTRLKLGAPHPPDLSAPRVRCMSISTIRARLRGRSSRRRSLASCV